MIKTKTVINTLKYAVHTKAEIKRTNYLTTKIISPSTGEVLTKIVTSLN